MFWQDYVLFLAKTFTLVAAIVFVVLFIVAISMKNRDPERGKLRLKKLNKHYSQLKKTVQHQLLPKAELKKLLKQDKKTKNKDKQKNNIYVLNFKGDIRASAVKGLREEVTAILTAAKENDEVVVLLESPGGMVHGYGLAASQLKRIKDHGIKLTVLVDKVAASGGYMMAVVADTIIAAPFAIIGSIGVIAQLPNFNKLLKKKDIEFEQITAGEYKRTLTMFGENTDKARAKFKEEIEETHDLFKNFVAEQRHQLDIDKVATGEHWFGQKAFELKLIDKIQTSDDYLLNASEHANLYELCYETKKSLPEKMASTAQLTINKLLFSWWQQSEQQRYWR